MALVKWLMGQKEVSESSLLTHLADKKKKGLSWNYVADKKYPAAPVTATLTAVIREAGGVVDTSVIEHVWHILYSVSDKFQLTAALTHYAEANHLTSVFVEKLGKQKPFAADYGAYIIEKTKCAKIKKPNVQNLLFSCGLAQQKQRTQKCSLLLLFNALSNAF